MIKNIVLATGLFVMAAGAAAPAFAYSDLSCNSATKDQAAMSNSCTDQSVQNGIFPKTGSN